MVNFTKLKKHESMHGHKNRKEERERERRGGRERQII